MAFTERANGKRAREEEGDEMEIEFRNKDEDCLSEPGYSEEDQKPEEVGSSGVKRASNEPMDFENASAAAGGGVDENLLAAILAMVEMNDFKGLLTVLETIPKEQRAQVLTTPLQGRLPLVKAVEMGDLAVVALLMDEGADLNQNQGCFPFTPLEAAVSEENAFVASFLIEKGAEWEDLRLCSSPWFRNLMWMMYI